MKRILGMVLVGAGFVCGLAQAANLVSPPLSIKRQLIDCMTKRMAASRTVSYNEATKACKDQIKARNDASASASNNVRALGTP